MVFDWKWFGEEIGFVLVSSFPENGELSFTYSVPDPVVAHCSGLELFYSDFLCRGFLCSGVVGGDGCGELWISSVFQDVLEDATSLAGDEKPCVLSFGN